MTLETTKRDSSTICLLLEVRALLMHREGIEVTVG